MEVIIVGEDAVTQAVIRRLINAICPEGISILREDPARGGQIKAMAEKYNRLAQNYRIILLADLDLADCPLTEQQAWLGGKERHPHFMFRFACDEAESWLLADRPGFARFLGVRQDLIPEATARNIRREPENREIRPRVKSSFFIMHELAPQSGREPIREGLIPKDRRSKGPMYNSTLIPFIQNDWNVETARQNSDSLNRMCVRLQEWCNATAAQ
jgi:hypothetical protein